MKIQAIASEDTFRMDCTVRCDIAAEPGRIWSLLTDATAFPTWCSSVTSLRGPIALGATLELRVPLDPKRTFKPKVTRLEENRTMEWTDGMAPMFKGVRTFRLTPRSDRVTEFEMRETFSGIMLPLIKKTLPDFRPSFETYAADLKQAAERSA